MPTNTSIEWTDVVWNPTRGCSRISPGCENCYAERMAVRFAGAGGPYDGLVRSGKNGPRWTGRLRLVDDALDAPMRWLKPRRVFVNSMSDLFHEDLSGPAVARVFATMELAEQHTFQVLTKRAAKMAEMLTDDAFWNEISILRGRSLRAERQPMPARNVWLGVSVEDQQRADERIPHLLATPAAVRFLSVEPLLGALDLRTVMFQADCRACSGRGTCGVCDGGKAEKAAIDRLDWVIVGGESGPGARECAIEWVESVVEQCKVAEVPVFVKQLGSNSTHLGRRIDWQAKKGGDPAEWPAHLSVREFPEVR